MIGEHIEMMKKEAVIKIQKAFGKHLFRNMIFARFMRSKVASS